jgi:hypothetical protein
MTNRLAELVESYRLATEQPPPGHILIHSRSTPRTNPGSSGFRAWWSKPAAEFVLCDCGWRPDLGKHYRIHRPAPLLRRTSRYAHDPGAEGRVVKGGKAQCGHL